MSRLTSILIFLLTANVLLCIGLVGVGFLAGSGPHMLRLSGTLDDGGYRLWLKGQYSSQQVVVLRRRIDARLERFEQQFSYQHPESDVSRLAETPPLNVARLAPGLRSALTHLVHASHLSGGHFSPYQATPFTAWWLTPRSQCRNLVQRFQAYQPNSEAALLMGPYFIPIMPVTLNMATLKDGLALDALAQVMRSEHIADYRLEVNGAMRAGQGDWQVRTGPGAAVALAQRTAMHGITRDGHVLWVVAGSGAVAATQLDALTALSAAQARRLAAQQGFEIHLAPAVSGASIHSSHADTAF